MYVSTSVQDGLLNLSEGAVDDIENGRRVVIVELLHFINSALLCGHGVTWKEIK